METVNLDEVIHGLGLPELNGLRFEDERFGHFVHASITGLSDGDFKTIHDPITEEPDKGLFGSIFYNQGIVAKKVLEAAIETGPDTTAPMYGFQTFLSESLTSPESRFRGILNVGSVIELTGGTLSIDGNPVSLPRVPRVVIDMGVCLNARNIINGQLRDLLATGKAYVYIPMARTHFTNLTIASMYDELAGKGSTAVAMQKRIYIGREDGIASATDELIRAPAEHNAPADIADIILCTNPQHTTREELDAGIRNSIQLLKTGGTLAIRALARPAAGEIGEPELSGIAEEAGFSPVRGLTYRASNHSMAAALLGGPAREFTTSILTRTTY